MAVSDFMYGFYLGCTCLVDAINGDAFVFTELGLTWRRYTACISASFILILSIEASSVSLAVVAFDVHKAIVSPLQVMTEARGMVKKFLIPSASWIRAGVISLRRNLYLRMDNWEILSARFFIMLSAWAHDFVVYVCQKSHYLHVLCFSVY